MAPYKNPYGSIGSSPEPWYEPITGFISDVGSRGFLPALSQRVETGVRKPIDKAIATAKPTIAATSANVERMGRGTGHTLAGGVGTAVGTPTAAVYSTPGTRAFRDASIEHTQHGMKDILASLGFSKGAPHGYSLQEAANAPSEISGHYSDLYSRPGVTPEVRRASQFAGAAGDTAWGAAQMAVGGPIASKLRGPHKPVATRAADTLQRGKELVTATRDAAKGSVGARPGHNIAGETARFVSGGKPHSGPGLVRRATNTMFSPRYPGLDRVGVKGAIPRKWDKSRQLAAHLLRNASRGTAIGTGAVAAAETPRVVNSQISRGLYDITGRRYLRRGGERQNQADNDIVYDKIRQRVEDNSAPLMWDAVKGVVGQGEDTELARAVRKGSYASAIPTLRSNVYRTREKHPGIMGAVDTVRSLTPAGLAATLGVRALGKKRLPKYEGLWRKPLEEHTKNILNNPKETQNSLYYDFAKKMLPRGEAEQAAEYARTTSVDALPLLMALEGYRQAPSLSKAVAPTINRQLTIPQRVAAYAALKKYRDSTPGRRNFVDNFNLDMPEIVKPKDTTLRDYGNAALETTKNIAAGPQLSWKPSSSVNAFPAWDAYDTFQKTEPGTIAGPLGTRISKQIGRLTLGDGISVPSPGRDVRNILRSSRKNLGQKLLSPLYRRGTKEILDAVYGDRLKELAKEQPSIYRIITNAAAPQIEKAILDAVGTSRKEEEIWRATRRKNK